MWKRRAGIVKILQVFRRQYLKTGTKQLVNTRLVPARIWGHEASGIWPTQRLTIGKQVEDVARQEKASVIGHFFEVENVELCDRATSCWEGKWADDM